MEKTKRPFWQKILIVLCVILIVSTCFTISTKYIRFKKIEEILVTVENDETNLSNSTIKNISELIEVDKEYKTFEENYLQAILYSSNGEYEKALEAYDKTLTLCQTDNEKEKVCFSKGIYYVSNLEYANAIEEFTNVLDINKDNAKALIYRADSYLQLQQYDKALEDINVYCKNNTLNETQYETVITVYLGLGDYENAITYETKAIESGYNDEQFVLYRLQTYLMLNKFDEAKEDCVTYSELVNEDIDPEIVMATSLYSLQKYEKALEVYSTYLNDHDDLSVYDEAIQCSYEYDDYEKMLELSINALAICEDEMILRLLINGKLLR